MSANRPEWLVYLIALIVRFLLQRQLARHARLPAWCYDRPDLPLASAQALAASIRGDFGNAIAWMCLRRGIGPGHKDWPELSRAIVRFGGSLKRFRPGMPALGLQWWENPEILPGAIGEIRPTPAADAMARILSRQEVPEASPPSLHIVPAGAEHAVAPPRPRLVFARATTGPPTGPPDGRLANFVMTHQRGQSMAGPAILIRAVPGPRHQALAA